MEQRGGRTRRSFPWFESYSGGLGKFVGPGMDDRMAVDVVDASHDARLQLVFGGYTDVAQHGASKLGEEAFDQVEPGAVLGGEGEFEASDGAGIEPCCGLS